MTLWMTALQEELAVVQAERPAPLEQELASV